MLAIGQVAVGKRCKSGAGRCGVDHSVSSVDDDAELQDGCAEHGDECNNHRGFRDN